MIKNDNNINIVNKIIKNRISQKQKDFLIIFNKNSCRVTTSCINANISRACFYKWYNLNPLFNNEVNKVKEQFLDFGEGQFVKLLHSQHPQIVLHFAKTKLKERGYGERQEIEITNINNLTKEEKEEEINRLLS